MESDVLVGEIETVKTAVVLPEEPVEAIDVKEITRKVNRYVKAADVLRDCKAKVMEYKDSGNFGVKITVTGIREREICEMVAKHLNSQLEGLSKTVRIEASSIMKTASSILASEVF